MLTAPNQVWTADLTYIWMVEDWLSLAMFLICSIRKLPAGL